MLDTVRSLRRYLNRRTCVLIGVAATVALASWFVVSLARLASAPVIETGGDEVALFEGDMDGAGDFSESSESVQLQVVADKPAKGDPFLVELLDAPPETVAVHTVTKPLPRTDTPKIAARLPDDPPALSKNKKPTAAIASAKPITFDPDQTSWEGPFEAAWWEAAGWEFDGMAMLSQETDASALFRRRYRRLMLQCHIEPQGKFIEALRLRLNAPDTKSVMTLVIASRTLSIIDEGALRSRLVRQAELSPALSKENAGDLRVAATGNRLIVSWNGKVVLTCDQSAAQSGKEFQFEFVSGRTPFRITGLRIEGE